jgi:hypothetical protein
MRSTVYAQDGVPIGPVFGSPFDSLGQIISTLLPNLYILAGVIFLVLIIAGGFGIISNAGKGKSDQVSQGKKALTIGVVGFLIIISSYWVIQIISAITGLNILEPSDIF